MSAIENIEFTLGPDGKICLMRKFRAKEVAKRIISEKGCSESAGATDYETLLLVWGRSNHSQNEAKALKIKQAIYDALVDCWEVNTIGRLDIQCADAGIARLLGALVLLDFDEKNWNLHRLEDLKNELFTLAKQTINQCATEAFENTNPLIAAVGKTFLAQTLAEIKEIGELDKEEEKKWSEDTKEKKKVRSALETKIEEFNKTLPGAIHPRFQKEIIDQALSAI